MASPVRSGTSAKSSPLGNSLKIKPARSDESLRIVQRLDGVSTASPAGTTTIFHASDAQNLDNIAEDRDIRKHVSRFIRANGEEEEEEEEKKKKRKVPSPSNGPSPTSTTPARQLSPSHSNPKSLGSPWSPGSQQFVSSRFPDVNSRPLDDTAVNGSHTVDDSSSVVRHHQEAPVRRLQFPDIIHGESPARGRAPTRDTQPSALAMSQPHSSPFITTRRPRLFSNSSNTSADTHGSAPLSPDKTDGLHIPGLEPIKEGSARIERKITDLEISNSSLLAINRTLEREMRKQSAELRRYQRISRAGGLAAFPTSFRSSVPSAGGEGEGSDKDDGSSFQDDNYDDDYSENDGSGTDMSRELSSVAENDSRLGVGDAKKVYVDIARHQGLLDGSRRMNHCIKRCLLRAEDLINDGRKALEYSVRANDVSLGGRVLPPEELSDVIESGHGLLSASDEARTVVSLESSHEEDGKEKVDSALEGGTSAVEE